MVPRVLRPCLALLAVAGVLAACEPVTLRVSRGGDEADAGRPRPDPTTDGGAGTDGGLPDAGRDGGGGGPPDAGAWDAGGLCWETEDLAVDVNSPVFTVDSEGVGRFAWVGAGGVEVGRTGPGASRSTTGWSGVRIGGIAVDARGATHLAFTDTQTLYVATEATGTWTRSPVSQGLADKFALDRDGFAHVLFSRDVNPYHLFYASNRSGAWEVTDLQASPSSMHTALAVDAAGHAHVAYSTFEPDNLFYLTNASGTWTRESLFDLAPYGTNGPALGLSPAGEPRIAYSSGGSWVDFASRREDGTWEEQAVAPSSGIGLAMVVDSRDVAHLAMDRPGEPRFAYATHAGGSWFRKPVASAEVPGAATTYLWDKFIGLDLRGGVHLAAYLGVFDEKGGWVGTRFRYAAPVPCPTTADAGTDTP